MQKKSILVGGLFIVIVFISSLNTVYAQKRYSGSKHNSSHGGSYSGGRGSSHKGGSYKLSRTSNHYGKHK